MSIGPTKHSGLSEKLVYYPQEADYLKYQNKQNEADEAKRELLRKAGWKQTMWGIYWTWVKKTPAGTELRCMTETEALLFEGALRYHVLELHKVL